MIKIKQGYKVVYNSPFKKQPLCSVWSPKTIPYYKGKKTKRPIKCGPLAVFNSLENAQNFASIDDQIFKCRYKESKDKKFWFFNTINGLIEYSEYSTERLPKGTRFADWVILLERIS
jgi:hypothetical protein